MSKRFDQIMFNLNAAFADIEACIEADDPRECLIHVKRTMTLTKEMGEAAREEDVKNDPKAKAAITSTLTRALKVYAALDGKAKGEKAGLVQQKK